MGLLEILTLLFITLKLTGVITWSWFYVLLPEIIAVSVYALFTILSVLGFIKVNKEINKEFKNFKR